MLLEDVLHVDVDAEISYLVKIIVGLASYR
jgi:hypothetical protein